ncbi:MAG TPA: hypothetical protein VFM58_17065 [Solirubrobacteraceae bacterium]|nr:hypothetical protein [Solirubrobacteraceae bacterium]
MAATKARTRAGSNGNGAIEKGKHAGGAVVDTASRATGPALTAGAAAVAGLAGGLLIGSRVGRRRSPGALAFASAKRFAAVAGKASNTADDIRAIREQLENANRRSPIEVVLDGLTHRPGTRKRERQFNIGS